MKPRCHQSGQAMVETLLAVSLFGVLIWAASLLGLQVAKQLQQDQHSRWLAFTTLPGGMMRAEGPGAAGLPLHGIKKGPRLDRPLLGRTDNAGELKRAWRYEDKGLIVAHAGTRATTVLRDAGYRENNADTQARIGTSRVAWRKAGDASKRLADQINVRGKPVDAAWRRPALSLDWLTPWADLEPRRKRGKRHPPQPAARLRWGRVQSAKSLKYSRSSEKARASAGDAARSRSATAHAIAYGACLAAVCCSSAVAAQVPAICPHFYGDAVQASHVNDALDEARDVARMLMARSAGAQNLAEVLSSADLAKDGIQRNGANVLLWNGVPMAYRDFTPDSNAHHTVLKLKRRWPALTDLAVFSGRVTLSGLSGSRHLAASWFSGPSEPSEPSDLANLSDLANSSGLADSSDSAAGRLSAISLRRPALSTAAASWLPLATRTESHVLTVDPSGSGFSVHVVWRVPGSANTAISHIAEHFVRDKWQAVSAAPMIWQSGACTIRVLVQPTFAQATAYAAAHATAYATVVSLHVDQSP